MLRKLRLTAAVILVCAVFLPLSECSQGPDHPSTSRPKTVTERLHPQTTTEFSYQYGYQAIHLDPAGLFTVIAFGWPLAFILFVRRKFGPRMRWFCRILELLLCAGTIYWLNVLSFHSFGATWLYGAYIGVIAVVVFTCLGIASWFVETPSAAATVATVCFLLVLPGSIRASAQDSVKGAQEFAIGGIGVAGTLSPSELALREIRDGPRAGEQLRKLLNEGTQAGRMYALYGLRQLEVADYEKLAAPYRASNQPVRRIQGCMISMATTSEVVKWIDQYARQIRGWEKQEPPRPQ
jgi:hypothetical protein